MASKGKTQSESVSVELKLYEPSGKEVGTKEVSAQIFAAAANGGLIHEMVRWQRAKKRAGTHSTKTRAEVRGGGAKPWRQKGTGRARAGTRNSPIWVGGGVAHGPKPRSYEFRINRKERKQALCGAISLINDDGKCMALTGFGLEELKTKQANGVLTALGIGRGDKSVVVVGEGDDRTIKSLKNIPGVKAFTASGLNVYDVVGAQYMVVTEQGLEGIEARLG